MAEERTYIPFTSRAKATTFDGILTEAHQIEDLDYGGAPKNQHDINAEVKANLARIEGIAGSAAAGAYVFKGSLNGLEDLLLLSNVKVGDVYNIKTEFELAGELNPGGAKTKYPAGTNVAATKAMSASVSSGWDALGGSFNLQPLEAKTDLLASNLIPVVAGIVADATIKENGIENPEKIVYVKAKKRFAAVKNTGKLGAAEYYSTWTGNSVLSPELYQEGIQPIKTKPYVVGKDIYAFDANGNFVKAGADVIDNTTDNTSTDKALSARATHAVAMEAALSRQGKNVTNIARAEKGAKIEMSGYYGGERHQPFQLVFVYEPADGGYGANSLCAFIGGKYYNVGGMSEESENVIKQGDFLRTPDGSIYTQSIMGNPCIYDASKAGSNLAERVNNLEGLLSIDGTGGGTIPGGGGSGGGTGGGASVEITQTTGQSTTAVMSQKAVTDKVTAVESKVAAAEAKVDELMLGSSEHVAAAWDYSSDSPKALKVVGNKDLVDLRMFVLDCTDNEGESTKPVGVTKRNNLFRYEDGSFAPAVRITEEQRAECDVELYRKPGGSELIKYCNAGEYDAAKFVEEFGVNEKLYTKGGQEVRVLYPWETTDKKYTHMVGTQQTLYYISAAKGTSGKLWSGIFTAQQQWDGINALELLPTAITPSPVYCIKDTDGKYKTRCFFALEAGLDEGQVHSAGSAGIGNLVTAFKGGRTYPTTNGINQLKNAEWARNNNVDPARTLPFAEGGYAARDIFVSYLETKYGRKDLHNANFFDGGISSNNSVTNETSWLKYGGVRYKIGGAGEWIYNGFSNQPNFCYDNQKKKSNWNTLLNMSSAKEQCMESQIAASWAVEAKITEGQHFQMYGGEYWWNRVPGTLGLFDGRMNARIYKLVKTKFSAFNNEGGSVQVEAEIVLAMSLYEGMKLSGDIWEYWGGGAETVGNSNDQSTSGSQGELLEHYLQPDQSEWATETGTSINAGETFGFEKTYIKTGTSKSMTSYAKRRVAFANRASEAGGSLITGECFYTYGNNSWGGTPGKRVRIGFRFCGWADDGDCSARSLFGSCGVTYGHADCGGSAQARLPQAAHAVATQ